MPAAWIQATLLPPGVPPDQLVLVSQLCVPDVGPTQLSVQVSWAPLGVAVATATVATAPTAVTVEIAMARAAASLRMFVMTTS